jgi:hypothetical protein
MHMAVNVCGNKWVKSCFYINKNIYIEKLLIIGSTGSLGNYIIKELNHIYNISILSRIKINID